MKIIIAIAVILFSSCAAFAADKMQPLDVKLGLWETTVATQMSGMPPIPPEALARMTPQQREQMQAAMAARGGPGAKPTVTKSCLTKDKLEKAMFGEERPNCKQTVVTSTSSKAEVRMECQEKQMKSTATVMVEALNSENVKGSVKGEASGEGNTMNFNSNFTSKWLGASCGKTE